MLSLSHRFKKNAQKEQITIWGDLVLIWTQFKSYFMGFGLLLEDLK